jgi:hypothetical protein
MNRGREARHRARLTGYDGAMRPLPALLICLFTAPLFLAAGLARADHGPGLRPEAMNPWVAALLWGAVGMAVAMIVAIVVMVFTRGPMEDGPDPPRQS